MACRVGRFETEDQTSKNDLIVRLTDYSRSILLESLNMLRNAFLSKKVR